MIVVVCVAQSVACGCSAACADTVRTADTFELIDVSVLIGNLLRILFIFRVSLVSSVECERTVFVVTCLFGYLYEIASVCFDCCVVAGVNIYRSEKYLIRILRIDTCELAKFCVFTESLFHL